MSVIDNLNQYSTLFYSLALFLYVCDSFVLSRKGYFFQHWLNTNAHSWCFAHLVIYCVKFKCCFDTCSLSLPPPATHLSLSYKSVLKLCDWKLPVNVAHGKISHGNKLTCHWCNCKQDSKTRTDSGANLETKFFKFLFWFGV